MPPSLMVAANRVPLSAYAGRPHPSRPAGAGYGGQGSDLYAWARQVVEKVRVASVGGRLRFLPWFDPYTDETPDMRKEYRTMLRESSVKAAFQTKILSVISEDIQFQPEDDNDPREQEGAAFCSYAFTHLKGGTRALGWSVLHPAVIDGHSVCEKVWDEHPLSRGRFKGKRIYHAVKAKDSHYLQLGIDPYRNVTALRGTGFNAGRVWSPSDFVIFSYFSLFENPSGMSDFRAAYRPYWVKDTSWKLRSLHLQQWTGPYLRGTYATQEQKAALEDAFSEAAASTWLTIPAGVLVDAVDLSMRGTSDFKDAIADCDREILIAIVGAHLQILEGQTGGARGNTKVHKEIGELIQWWLAATLADTYQAQLVVPLMAENYHDVEPPRVTVGAITDEDMLQRAKVYQALQQVGLKLSQKAVYRSVSIQPPDPNDPDDTLEPPGGGGGPKPPGPGGGGGEGANPFAEPRRFCQEGENKGKPGPCPEGKGDATPAPGASPAGPPPKKTFERQEEIADKHLGNMRALLSRLESGTYTPADVLDDLDSYATPSLAANARNWSARLGLLKQRLAETYGAAALDSPEWGAVRAAFRGARAAAAEHLSGMADTVRTVALYHAANPDAPVKVRGTDDWHALGEAHDALVRAGYDATHAIADALDAFKAAHRPATGHAEVFWERPPPVPRRFCQEGPNKGKPGPCPKPKQAPSRAPGKPPKATAEEAHDHIERVRQNPTPEGVRAVAETLSRITVKDVNALKQRLGIRAGGPKAALVQKVAHEATRRLTVRERYVREARALGYSVKDLTATARAHRQVYNEVADEAGRMLRDARAQYQQFTGGGRLFRGMSAFRSGDYTEIPHFDQIAESLRRRHPDLLPGDAQEGYERLFTLLSAGPPARMGYEQSLEKAMSELQSHGPQERRGRRQAVPPEEEIPFAEAGAGRLGAILDAMLDAAGDPGRLAVLAEMADDPEGKAPADDDPTPPDPAAQARVAGWVDDLTRGRMEGDGGGGADRFAEGDGLFHGPTPPGPGWVQVGVGPHGGKRWRKGKGGAKGAGKPEGKGLATGAAVPRSPRGGEAVGGKRPHKGLATGRAVPKAPRGEGNPEPEQSSPRGTTRAAGTAKDALPDEPAERRPGRDRPAGSTRGDTQATDAPRAAHKSRTAGLEEAHAQATAAYEQAHAAWEEETARLEKGYEAAHAAWEARGEKRDRLGDLAGKDAAGLVEQLAPVEGTLGRMRAAVPKTDAAGPGGRLAARGEAAAYAAAALSTWDDAYGPGGQLARGLGEAGLSADDLAPVLAAAAKGRASLEKTGQRYLAATDRYLSARAKREEHEAKEPPDPFDLEEPDPDDDAFPDQASYDAAHAGWQQEYDSAVDKQDVWQEKMDTLSGREEELAQVMEELTDGLDDEWVEQDERVTKALDKVQQGIQRRVEKEEEADPEPEEPEPPPEPEEPDEPDWPEEPEEDDPRAHPHAEGR